MWKSFDCPAGEAGCSVEFEDPDFEALGRDTPYYIRAVETPIETINAAWIRIERDGGGM